jgi:hypothetical protein
MSAGPSVAVRPNALHGGSIGAGFIERIDNFMLLEEVKKVVQRAAAVGHTLQIAPHAKRLLQAFYHPAISHRRIADELIIEAIQAGVPVEIDRCD